MTRQGILQLPSFHRCLRRYPLAGLDGVAPSVWDLGGSADRPACWALVDPGGSDLGPVGLKSRSELGTTRKSSKRRGLRSR